MNNSPPHPERYMDRPRRYPASMKDIRTDRIPDTSSRLWPKTRRRRVGLLLISAVLMVTILAGCGGGQAPADDSPQRATPSTADEQPPPAAFPRHGYPLGTDRGGDYFAGQLVLREGCLLVEVPPDSTVRGASLVVVWPSSFSLHTDSGTVQVADGRGRVVAQAGDHVRFSRAAVAYEEGKRRELVTGLPGHCPPGAFLVGDEVTAFDPENEVTELRLSDPDVLLLRQETVVSLNRVFQLAAGVGDLVLDGPCLRLNDGATILWPAGFMPDVEDGVLQVRNGAGQTIARVGDG